MHYWDATWSRLARMLPGRFTASPSGAKGRGTATDSSTADLAAMVLNPLDFAVEGLSMSYSHVQESCDGAFSDRLLRLSEFTGISRLEIDSILSANDWLRLYSLTLVKRSLRNKYVWDSLLVSYVIEFPNGTSAESAYREIKGRQSKYGILDVWDEPPPEAESAADTRSAPGRLEEVDPLAGRTYTFSFLQDRFIAGIHRTDYDVTVPLGLSMASLAQKMADRIARYSMLGAAPLSKRALRIGDLWHCDAYCDLYTMFDGKAVPFSWASDSWLDTHTLAEGTDMYIVHRRWRDLPTKPEFEVLIFDFKSESAIEEWFRDFNLFTRQRDSTAVSNVERLGDDSRLYRNMNEDGASDFVEAQRIVVRIGLQAFTIFLSASKCFATDVLVGLARLQLERLGGASVGGSVPFPQELL